MDLSLYDAAEINALTREVVNGVEEFNTTEDDDPEVYCWGVYLHLRAGGVECVADCMTRAHAELVAEALEKMPGIVKGKSSANSYNGLRLYDTSPRD